MRGFLCEAFSFYLPMKLFSTLGLFHPRSHTCAESKKSTTLVPQTHAGLLFQVDGLYGLIIYMPKKEQWPDKIVHAPNQSAPSHSTVIIKVPFFNCGS